MSTAERTAFLEAALTCHVDAERALHSGDIEPRLTTWSHGEDVTLFGAGAPYRTGWRDIRAVFDWLATTLRSFDPYELESWGPVRGGDFAFLPGLGPFQRTLSADDAW